jgi:hypothetical protein
MQGFVDGDLVERFLTLDPELQASVVKKVTKTDGDVGDSVASLLRIVEECLRLH